MAFAKLRIHTETTLKLFESTTRLLGEEIRRFQKKVCPGYIILELPREEAARGRKHASLVAKGHDPPIPHVPGRQGKKLNLHTYKYHALGDYPEAIHQFGTTDSYSTQLVSNLVTRSGRDCLQL